MTNTLSTRCFSNFNKIRHLSHFQKTPTAITALIYVIIYNTFPKYLYHQSTNTGVVATISRLGEQCYQENKQYNLQISKCKLYQTMSLHSYTKIYLSFLMHSFFLLKKQPSHDRFPYIPTFQISPLLNIAKSPFMAL